LHADTEIPFAWTPHQHANVAMIQKSGFSWHRAVAKQVRSNAAIDLYVSPTSYIVPALLGRAKPHVIVVHDLIAFRDEPHDRKAKWIEKFTLKRAAFSAVHIVAVSGATKKDLLARHPSLEYVTVVHAGPLRSQPKKNIGDRKTILCIGTLSPRKNQERLVRAYRQLPPDIRAKYDLLLAGARGWDDEDILKLAEETTGVSWADYVTDEEYEDLLTHCHIFALPSLYEGFGMQILDALQRGMPVLTSAEGSLAEVAGDAAYLVNPLEVSSIMEGLERLVKDTKLREELRHKGPKQAALFTWKRTVDVFLTAILNR
jgi:glycosyltransferase involved in cell wall biosynthesis